MEQIIISKDFLRALVGKKIISISYLSSEGKLSNGTYRFSVTKHLKNPGAKKADDGKVKSYFTAFRMGKAKKDKDGKEVNRYTTFTTNRVISIKVAGVIYSYAQLVEMYLDFLSSGGFTVKVCGPVEEKEVLSVNYAPLNLNVA